MSNEADNGALHLHRYGGSVMCELSIDDLKPWDFTDDDAGFYDSSRKCSACHEAAVKDDEEQMAVEGGAP